MTNIDFPSCSDSDYQTQNNIRTNPQHQC